MSYRNFNCKCLSNLNYVLITLLYRSVSSPCHSDRECCSQHLVLCWIHLRWGDIFEQYMGSVSTHSRKEFGYKLIVSSNSGKFNHQQLRGIFVVTTRLPDTDWKIANLFSNIRSDVSNRMVSILLNIMFHAPMGIFQLELIYYLSPSSHPRLCVSFL